MSPPTAIARLFSTEHAATAGSDPGFPTGATARLFSPGAAIQSDPVPVAGPLFEGKVIPQTCRPLSAQLARPIEFGSASSWASRRPRQSPAVRRSASRKYLDTYGEA